MALELLSTELTRARSAWGDRVTGDLPSLVGCAQIRSLLIFPFVRKAPELAPQTFLSASPTSPTYPS